MGTETTSATYRRTQNPLVTKFFYEITGTQRTNSKYLAHTSEKTVLPTKKTALSTPPQSYNKNQSFVSHIVRKFHFRVLDANQFGLPVIYPEKFCRKWAQMRKYQACVFYMPILLRICPSGSAHYLQTFHDKLRNPKEYQQILCTNPPQYAILISIK